MSAFSRHPVASTVPKLRAGELPEAYRQVAEPEPIDTSPLRVLVDVHRHGDLAGAHLEWLAWIRVADLAGDRRARGAGGDTLPELETHVLNLLDELEAASAPRKIAALWTVQLRPARWADVSDVAGLRRWREDPRTVRPPGHDDDNSNLPLPSGLWDR